MFCPNCGTQNSDGAKFCEQCGAAIDSGDVRQEMPSLEPLSDQQPTYAQPTYTQPSQPMFDQQPLYAQQGGVQTAVKTNKTPIIIASSVVVIVAAVLVVLFMFILPNSNVKGRLSHKWSLTENGVTVTYDFKNNEASMGNMNIPITWELTGDDGLSVTVSMFGVSNTQDFKFKISGDGRSLTLTEVSSSSSVTLTRDD